MIFDESFCLIALLFETLIQHLRGEYIKTKYKLQILRMLRLPLCDLLQISTQKHLRNWHIIHEFRSSIVWSFEILHPVFDRVTLVYSALFFFDYTRYKPCYRLNHHTSRHLTSQENKLPQRNFFEILWIVRLKILFKSIINPLISPTDKNQIFLFTQSICELLCKDLLRWGRKKQWEISFFQLIFCDNCIHSINNWLCLDEHPFSSAIDLIINLLVLIFTKISGIDEFKCQNSFFLRLSNERSRQKALKKLREQGNYKNFHPQYQNKYSQNSYSLLIFNEKIALLERYLFFPLIKKWKKNWHFP